MSCLCVVLETMLSSGDKLILKICNIIQKTYKVKGSIMKFDKLTISTLQFNMDSVEIVTAFYWINHES